MAINLLPQEEKRELKLGGIHQKVFSLSVFFIIFLFLLIAILFYLRVHISLKVDSLKSIIVAREAELQTSQFQGFRKTISQANQDLSKIQELWQGQVLTAPFFEKLNAVTPESIYFTTVTLQKQSGLVDVRIAGFAPRREVLFSFKNNLEATPNFTDVYFLPLSWVKPTDITFSLTLKYTP